ncbi:MAG TPA: hypothetical protein VI138_01415 [Candidatus Dormibacteraeota bacterium]
MLSTRSPGRGLMQRKMRVVVTAGILAGVACFSTGTVAASARVIGMGGPGLPASAPALTGADISYPECGSPLPFGQAFAVVGVNGGRANTPNPCLGVELGWAAAQTSGGGSSGYEPRASLYLNTGDPGSTYLGQAVPDWPNSGVSPFGACLPAFTVGRLGGPGQDSPGCAFVYGYLKTEQDLVWLEAAALREHLPATPASYPFWLDVELSNSWEDSTLMNSADLEAMVYVLERAGVSQLGVYALPSQWVTITGGATTYGSSSLNSLSDWLMGAPSAADARAACAKPGFTEGRVLLTQFPQSWFDGDFAC